MRLKVLLSIFIPLALLFLVGYVFQDRIVEAVRGENITQAEVGKTDMKYSGDFRLDTEYLGDSSWKYKVSGTLPTPCYWATVDSIVAESFPEQVTITVNLIKPEKDSACVQVLQDFEKEGDFTASELAQVTLKVIEED